MQNNEEYFLKINKRKTHKLILINLLYKCICMVDRIGTHILSLNTNS